MLTDTDLKSEHKYSQLPETLNDWRCANYYEDEIWNGEKIWDLLGPMLARHRLTSWKWLGDPFAMLRLRPGEDRDANGYIFVGPSYNKVTLSDSRRTYHCAVCKVAHAYGNEVTHICP